MGDPIMPEDLGKKKGTEKDSKREKEEKKKKGRVYPRVGEIPR
jgi:hypothetical protein